MKNGGVLSGKAHGCANPETHEGGSPWGTAACFCCCRGQFWELKDMYDLDEVVIGVFVVFICNFSSSQRLRTVEKQKVRRLASSGHRPNHLSISEVHVY